MRNLLIIVFSAFATLSLAQNGTIRGSVIEDRTGETFTGALVVIKNTTNAAATDLDGKFTLTAKEGVYDLEVSFISFKSLTITGVQVKANEVTILNNLRLKDDDVALDEIVITVEAARTSEEAIMSVKKRSASMIDGISSEKMQLSGDGNTAEAAKRITGVSVEGGKYIYVRGLGDRYSKTTLNGMDIPGLDPDRNALQMDIFPTSLVNNITISKNFTADMPADFTGGLINVETKDFPDKKIFNVSASTAFNPNMHFRSDFLTYKGGKTDFLGFDDGTRGLPNGATLQKIPTPISGASSPDVNSFVSSFNPQLGATKKTSLLDFSGGISIGNQKSLSKDSNDFTAPTIGYVFSLSYKSEYKHYDEVSFGEYQRYNDPNVYDLRYATVQNGQMSERSFLIGALGGFAYKTQKTKIKFTFMRLQNGESRAAQFDILNDGQAVGQSGYIAASDNLEYNQRALNNMLVNGVHELKKDWEIDWRVSPTYSTSQDPDIRKTAFTQSFADTSFNAGAGGNPSRIWRSLDELNLITRFDATKKYKLFDRDAKFKTGISHSYKERNYEILQYEIQFFGSQNWASTDPNDVLNPENLYPNTPNSVYYQSGNNYLNSNAYQSNINNTGLYASTEFNPSIRLKTIVGVRFENFVQKHTGRDQKYSSGDLVNGKNLQNEKVLESFNWFPSLNFIYSLNENQNFRAAYSQTIARPSFKELSFAQISDPITNRIFNGSLFSYPGWDGKLVETNVHNMDFRWEKFMSNGQIISVSAFYKNFRNPIELVRIPEQQTSTEYQPRNVGNGNLYGLEFEFKKNLDFINEKCANYYISGNYTLVESQILMTDLEYNSRKSYEKEGETITSIRKMAGQAPYIINTGIGYKSFEKGIDVGLFYNVKGPALFIVGAGLFPDVYTEPFHSLNFGFNKSLGKEERTTVDFKITNLLNDKIEHKYYSFKAESQIFSSLNLGRTFSLGISHKF